MASNDVVGALYYKVVLDPRGFAKGAAVVKSEQDLITRALKATTSDYDRLQAELEAVGERAAKAGAVERAVLEKYKKQIISDMEDIINLEKERADQAAKQKVLAEEKKVLNAMQESLDKAKERKKIQKQLADEQVREARRVAKEKLAAEKERVREEKALEKSLAEFRKQRHGRRFQDLSRYLTSFARLRVGARRLKLELGNVNGGLSKMAGNLAQAAGMSPAIQGLARSFGALGIKILAIGAGITAFVKFMSAAIMAADRFRKQQIKLMPLLDNNAEKTRRFMDEVMSLAARTGFATETMFSLSEALINVGMSAEKAVSVGKLLAGLSGGDEQRLKSIAKAYTDVMMKGRLMGQEALQFANAGIPIYKAISDSLKVSAGEARKMMEEGLISAEQMSMALQQFGMTRNLGQQMAENMKTVSGQFARIKTLVEQIMAEIGSGKDTTLAGFLKWTGDILENFRLYHALWKELFKDIDSWASASPAVALLLLLKRSADEFFMTEEERARRRREDQKKAEAELEERIKNQKEAAKLQEETFKAAQDHMREQARMSEKEREAMEKRMEFEEHLASLNVNEEQKNYLRLQHEIINAKQELIEKEKERIELERNAAEEKVNREANQARRGMQGAVSGAGPSFGAGSTGEFNFLRDMILNKRERSEEIKIQKKQEASLANIDKNSQLQLDALNNLQPGGPTQQSVAIGGP